MEQLQSWNNFLFDPQKMDVDKQIDLVSTLGNMLGQEETANVDKFIETMWTLIQIHLVMEKTWVAITKKAKELGHIIQKCEGTSYYIYIYASSSSFWLILSYCPIR